MTALDPAYRFDFGGRIAWHGSANGCRARFVTDDPALRVFIRPVNVPGSYGVALVDAEGKVLMTEFIGRWVA